MKRFWIRTRFEPISIHVEAFTITEAIHKAVKVLKIKYTDVMFAANISDERILKQKP